MNTPAFLQKKNLPLTAAVIALCGMAVLAVWRGANLSHRVTDTPPEISFTWQPAGAVTLQEFKGHIHITDDHALDFKTYKITFVEAGRELPFPLADQIIGKEYDDENVYLSLLATDPKMTGKTQLTVRIEVADDAGQKSTLEKVIDIKPPAGTFFIQ